MNSSQRDNPWWSRKEASNSSPWARSTGTAHFFKEAWVEESESIIKEREKGMVWLWFPLFPEQVVSPPF